MQVTVKTTDPAASRADLLALPIAAPKGDGGKPRLPTSLRALDRAFSGVISAAIDSGDFRGRVGQT